MHPSFAKHKDRRVGKGAKRRAQSSPNASSAWASLALSPPYKALPRKQGSGAPKGACPTNDRDADESAKLICARLRAVRHAAFRRSRLRHSPPATTPMAQLQNRVSRRRPLTGVSPASPAKLPRLSTLRADRSLCRSTGDPEPPGSGLAKKQKSARGDRTSPTLLRHAVRNGALHKAR
jgi:hypothetical protein